MRRGGGGPARAGAPPLPYHHPPHSWWSVAGSKPPEVRGGVRRGMKKGMGVDLKCCRAGAVYLMLIIILASVPLACSECSSPLLFSSPPLHSSSPFPSTSWISTTAANAAADGVCVSHRLGGWGSSPGLWSPIS